MSATDTEKPGSAKADLPDGEQSESIVLPPTPCNSFATGFATSDPEVTAATKPFYLKPSVGTWLLARRSPPTSQKSNPEAAVDVAAAARSEASSAKGTEESIAQACPVCDGSGVLLSDPCPLCRDATSSLAYGEESYDEEASCDKVTSGL